MPRITTPIRSILVYTDGEVIGDGILKLPFAAALKQAVAGVRLTWLCGASSVYETALAELARQHIDELIILPNRRISASDFLRRPAILRDRQFDLIIDTQRKARRTCWLKRIRHRRFISAAAGGLLSNVKPPKPLSPHVFEQLMQLGSCGTGEPLIVPPLTLAQEWDATAAALLPEGARYIGFVVGAGHPDKCWPLAQFIALAQSVSRQGYTPVIFLGPQEKPYASTIREALPQALFPLTMQAHACASPYLTIALGKRLIAAVANDSGGCHLLAAGGAPLVTLFRSASVRSKFLPRSSRVIALAPEDFGVATMRDIPLAAVATALETLTS